MTGYISNNLDKVLSKNYICISKSMITEENFNRLGKEELDRLSHIVIDINCINNQSTLYQLVKLIKEHNKDIQIIIIYYQEIEFINLYEYEVYDFIKFQSKDLIVDEIEHLKHYPLKLSDYAMSGILKQKFEYIIGVINLEHQSYTSTFIAKIMEKIDDIFLLETKEVNTSILEYQPNLNGIHYSPQDYCKQNVMNIIKTIPNSKILIIDFGKFSRCDKELLVKLYPQLDACLVVDTNNEITKSTKYYHDSINILESKTKTQIINIPKSSNKLKYKKMVKEYVSELKKI